MRAVYSGTWGCIDLPRRSAGQQTVESEKQAGGEAPYKLHQAHPVSGILLTVLQDSAFSPPWNF